MKCGAEGTQRKAALADPLTEGGHHKRRGMNEALEGEFCHLKRREGLRLTYCISVIRLMKAQYISKHQFP